MLKSPMKFINIYIMFTLLMSIIGPMKYYDYDIMKTFLYVSICMLVLNIGYYLAKKNNFVFKKNIFVKNKDYDYNYNRIKKFMMISIKVNLIVSIVLFLEIFLRDPSRFNILNIGANYGTIYEGENGYTIATLIRFATSFFKTTAIILGMYYFDRMKKKERVIYCFSIFIMLIVYMLGYGIQSQAGYIAIYFLAICFLKLQQHGFKQGMKLKVFALLIILISFFTFAYIQGERAYSHGTTVENYGEKSIGRYYDTEHLVFKIFGKDKLGFGVASLLCGYLSDGYVGLSQSFQLPFQWTYFVGGNLAANIIEKTTNIEIFSKTYLGRLKSHNGRDGLSTWNTIFPWLATDFTWIGTIFLMFLFGCFFSKTFQEAKNYKNPISVILYANIFLGFVFIPSNNQLFQGVDSFFSTWGIIFLWIWQHNKFNQTKFLIEDVEHDAR